MFCFFFFVNLFKSRDKTDNLQYSFLIEWNKYGQLDVNSQYSRPHKCIFKKVKYNYRAHFGSLVFAAPKRNEQKKTRIKLNCQRGQRNHWKCSKMQNLEVFFLIFFFAFDMLSRRKVVGNWLASATCTGYLKRNFFKIFSASDSNVVDARLCESFICAYIYLRLKKN